MPKFSSSQLRAAIDKAKAKTFAPTERTPIAFLPEGEHKIRLFFDPEGELSRKVRNHRTRTKQRIMCPNSLPKSDDVEIPSCEICKIAEELDNWRMNARTEYLVYGYLYQTNVPSEYWQPGKWYCLVANGRFNTALMKFLESLVETSEDFLVTLLDPTVSGGVLATTVVKGAQGSVSMTSIPGMTIDPIELEEKLWVPLEEVYVETAFLEAPYTEEVKALREEHYLEDGVTPKIAIVKEGEQPTTATTTAAPASDASFASLDDSKTATTDTATSTDATTTTADSTTPVDQAPKDSEAIVNTSKQKTVMSTEGTPIELSDEVVERGCWSHFNATDPVCIMCVHGIDCNSIKTMKEAAA